MKLKILAITVMLVLLISALIVSANIKQYNYNNKKLNENSGIELKVAIYDDFLFKNENSSGGKFFIHSLRDYKWKVGNQDYYFTITILSTDDILDERLKVSDFDVLIYTPDQADLYLSYTGFSNLTKNKIRVREIRKFVEDGGGYYGSCGAGMIAGNMINEPNSFGERSMKNSCLKISCSYFEYHSAIPLLTQIIGRAPSTIGQNAYLFNCGWGVGPHLSKYSGIAVDCNISKDNPIFDDIIGETRKIRWINAPAFIFPDKLERKTMILGTFPETEFSDNETVKIHHWKYIGGLSGLLKAFLKPDGGKYWIANSNRFTDAWVFAKDWVDTGQVVETNIADKPFMTAEVYLNENQARIVICSGHPEFGVMWGGHIEDVDDDKNNSLYEGFYTWKNITPPEITIEDEKTYNYCIVRRIIAWASKKVPDNDLPPIHGPSQVSDIYPYLQNTRIDINGNSVEADGISSLDLFFRYSNDNETWTDWTYYSTDYNITDGWSWIFNSSNGTGYYQFYSIRHVKFGDEELIENAPNGPDAVAHIIK